MTQNRTERTESYSERQARLEREREEYNRLREERQSKLPSVKIEDEVWTSTEKEDNRHYKRYTRTVRVGVTMLVRDYRTQDRLRSSFGQGYLPDGEYARTYWGYIDSAIEEAFAGAPWPCRVKLDGGGTSCTYGKRKDEGWDYHASFYISATYRAPKPSKIPSEEQLLEWLGGADNIGSHLRAAILKGIQRAKEAAAAVERARIANIILGGYVEQVDEKSREAVRYNQRLAALNAEYEAEREVQCAKLLSDLGDDKCGIEWSDDASFKPDPRSIAAAKAKLPERVARLHAPTRRSPFPSDRETYDIKIADVE